MTDYFLMWKSGIICANLESLGRNDLIEIVQRLDKMLRRRRRETRRTGRRGEFVIGQKASVKFFTCRKIKERKKRRVQKDKLCNSRNV